MKIRNIITYVSWFFKGAVIGVANIIPGVSGGTMALLLGIYERIISAINNIKPAAIIDLVSIFRFNREGYKRFMRAWQGLDLLFLLHIGAGAFAVIISLAGLITHLLKTKHDITYGFFFGMVLASTFAPYRLIKKLNISSLVPAICSLCLILLLFNNISRDKLVEKAEYKHRITQVDENKKNESGKSTGSISMKNSNFIFVFFLGVISITAMILPGISGSLLLLAMGGYFQIMHAIAHREMIIILLFGMGCFFGLMISAKLLIYLLKRWHDQTMGFLLGLVIGSLWVVWPFKHMERIGTEIVYLNNSWPEIFGVVELYTLISAFLGFFIVLLFYLMEKRESHT